MGLSRPRFHDAVSHAGLGSLGPAIVGGVGIATLTIHLVHLAVPVPGGRVAVIASALVPIVLSLALLGAASRWLAAEIEPRLLRVGVWCVVGTAVLGTVSVESILYQRAAGGRTVDVLFVLTIHATVGAVLGVVVGSYDVGRRRTEERARAARRRAERSTSRLSVLNRVLRHDLRNAVTVILGHAERLQDGASDPRVIAARIVEAATELHEISDRARAVESLIGDGTDSERVDVVGLLEAELDRLGDRHPDLAVETDLPTSATVRAHPLLDTALENVLENAVVHNDRPEPAITVSVRERGGPGEVAVRVADNGPGIPEEERAALDRGTEEPLEHASGLGLWLVAWVVRESGGEVLFARNEPRGSAVTLRLPAA